MSFVFIHLPFLFSVTPAFVVFVVGGLPLMSSLSLHTLLFFSTFSLQIFNLCLFFSTAAAKKKGREASKTATSSAKRPEARRSRTTTWPRAAGSTAGGRPAPKLAGWARSGGRCGAWTQGTGDYPIRRAPPRWSRRSRWAAGWRTAKIKFLLLFYFIYFKFI